MADRARSTRAKRASLTASRRFAHSSRTGMEHESPFDKWWGVPPPPPHCTPVFILQAPAAGSHGQLDRGSSSHQDREMFSDQRHGSPEGAGKGRKGQERAGRSELDRNRRNRKWPGVDTRRGGVLRQNRENRRRTRYTSDHREYEWAGRRRLVGRDRFPKGNSKRSEAGKRTTSTRRGCQGVHGRSASRNTNPSTRGRTSTRDGEGTHNQCQASNATRRTNTRMGDCHRTRSGRGDDVPGAGTSRSKGGSEGRERRGDRADSDGTGERWRIALQRTARGNIHGSRWRNRRSTRSRSSRVRTKGRVQARKECQGRGGQHSGAGRDRSAEHIQYCSRTD